MEAIMHTNLGDIRLELFEDKAPITVTNFVELATGKRAWIDPATGEETQRPLYDGVTFHRVIKDFMIQGGDPLGNGTGGPGYTFDDEIDNSLTFADTYLLAMANAGTRMGHGTNGSQFFITTVATPWLQGKHTIFGKIHARLWTLLRLLPPMAVTVPYRTWLSTPSTLSSNNRS